MEDGDNCVRFEQSHNVLSRTCRIVRRNTSGEVGLVIAGFICE